MRGNACSSDEGRVKPDASIDLGRSLDFLLEACLGFSLAVCSVTFAYAVVVRQPPDHVWGSAYAVLMALVIAATMRAGGHFSERLQGKRGQRALLAIYAVCTALCVPLCFVHASVAVILCAGVSLTTVGFVYGDFLNKLPRRSLMTAVDLLILCVGLSLLVLTALDGLALLLAHVALVVAAVGLMLAYSFRREITPDPVSDADSKARHIPLRGNRRSLFAIGFMFSAVGLGFWLDLDVEPDTIWLTIGGVTFAAGISSFAIRSLDERNYKDILLKGMSVSSAVFLLPVTFVPNPIKFAFLFLFVFVAVLEVIVVINAVVESARFNMISPIWLYGREASVFFLGIAVGMGLYTVGGYLSLEHELAMNATICIAVMVIAILQVKVNYLCYPFESVLEAAEPDEEIVTAQAQTGRYKALWQRKVQTACERYRLSPREREVLHYLVKGRDTKYIMDTFYISQSTAKTHIYNIYRKFDIHSRQDLLDLIEEIEIDMDEDE